MRKRTVVLFILMAAVCGLFANHFTPVWWGQNPSLAMNFYIYGAAAAGTPLGAGDEIGIFDGNTLVGSIPNSPSSGFSQKPNCHKKHIDRNTNYPYRLNLYMPEGRYV